MSCSDTKQARQQEEEVDEDDEEDELEEAPPQEEAPTDNDFDEESHAGSEAEQDVAPSGDDENDDYDDVPQPTKAKPAAVKKPKPGKVLYDGVQRAREELHGRSGSGRERDREASNAYGFLNAFSLRAQVSASYSYHWELTYYCFFF